MKPWPKVRLGDVLVADRRPVAVNPIDSYREIGIRSFGRGIFDKPPISGDSLGRKRVFEVTPDRLVLNIVFAWEGAVARTTGVHAGAIVSHRFPQFAAVEEDLDLDYVVYALRGESGLELMRKASPGSAGRNRTLSIGVFMDSEIPLPPIEEQRRIATWLSGVERISQLAESRYTKAENHAKAVVESLLSAIPERRSIDSLVDQIRMPVPVMPDRSYPLLGVKWYGKGVFLRETKDGRDIAARMLYEVEPGDFVFNRLFGWKGAFAIADRAGFVSNEFPIFRGREEICSNEYLGVVCRSPRFAEEVEGVSRGVTSGSRRRLSESEFLRMRVPWLQVKQQENIVRLSKQVGVIRDGWEEQFQRMHSALPSAINEVFGS